MTTTITGREVVDSLTGVKPRDYEKLCGKARHLNSLYFEVRYSSGAARLTALAPLDETGEIGTRTSKAFSYLSELIAFASLEDDHSNVFQGDDCPENMKSVSWGRIKNNEEVILVPDLYYLQAIGYRNFLPNGVRPWANRRETVIWRGATTGGFFLDTTNMGNVPRVRLCEIARTNDKFDCKIYNVVQAATERDNMQIKDMLVREKMFGLFIDPEELSLYKYIIQIDGNANSWGFIQKLRLGCCIFYVESVWEHWHSRLARPWEHYIPVAADLSDLMCKHDWCRSNDRLAAGIAARGRNLALSVDYEAEMMAAANFMLDSHTD